jgi:hypothetical protein
MFENIKTNGINNKQISFDNAFIVVDLSIVHIRDKTIKIYSNIGNNNMVSFLKLSLFKKNKAIANKIPILILLNIFAKGIVIKIKSININKFPSFVLIITLLKNSTIFE